MIATEKQLSDLFFLIQSYDGSRTITERMQQAWYFVADEVRRQCARELRQMSSLVLETGGGEDVAMSLRPASRLLMEPPSEDGEAYGCANDIDLSAGEPGCPVPAAGS